MGAAPAPLLVGGQRRDLGADSGKLLLRGEPVLGQGRDAGAHLAHEALQKAQAGDLNGFFGLVVDNLSILGFLSAALILLCEQ